jgi:hypothetical protein
MPRPTYAEIKQSYARKEYLERQILILERIIQQKDSTMKSMEVVAIEAGMEIRRLQYRIDSLEKAYRILANQKGREE